MTDPKELKLGVLARVRKNVVAFRQILNDRIGDPGMHVTDEYLERALGLDELQREIERE